MTNEIATLGIKIENFQKIAEVNELLHHFSDDIIARMGMPYEKRNIRLIHVILDTPQGQAEHLAESLNAIDGVTAEIMFL